MLFLEDLNVFHLDGKEIPCITAAGAPDSRFPGAPGSLCMDTVTGCLYLCTAADILQKSYSWKVVGDADPNMIRQAVSDYLAAHPADGTGISGAAIELLITILHNAVFSSNQTGNIAALRAALVSGGGEIPKEPDEPAAADDITIANGVMTIVTVGSDITVSDGVMTIA